MGTRATNRIQTLAALGQSAWLDFLDRRLLLSGELRRMIDVDGLRGLTSNPSIFQKAIATTSDYDALIREAPPSESHASILERIMIRDLGDACDELRSVYDATRGADGFASIEVDPRIANDTAAQVEQAKRLWDAVHRPNLMVKIPATRPGLPAIESCLAHGVNINITLLFSVNRYREVIEAHLRALEKRVALGAPIDGIASVASFFVSRVDTKIDKLLDAMPNALRGAAGSLRGQIAIANAKLAYEEYERIIASERWKALAQKGARPQRLLWGSTSPKDPLYADTYYVEALVGRDTVDTMTREVFRAYLDHGEPAERLTRDRDRAHAQIAKLEELAIDLERITDQLEEEGIEAFVKAFRESVSAIEKKRAQSVWASRETI
jgi:transaldolase